MLRKKGIKKMVYTLAVGGDAEKRVSIDIDFYILGVRLERQNCNLFALANQFNIIQNCARF